MKIETKITLTNTLINSGIVAAALVAALLITRVLIDKSKNKKEIGSLNNLNIEEA